MKRYFPLLLLCLIPILGFGQAGKLKKKDLLALKDAEARLTEIAYTLHTDSVETVRFQACKQLISGLVEALKTSNSFNYEFSELEGVAIRYAPDRSFRTITWELHVNRDEYRHYGAIQFNSKKLNLKPLLDRSSEWRTNPENMVVAADNWLGYIIYDIIPGGTIGETPYYFVFGYDRHSGFIRRKVLDVLTFDAYDNVQFGLPVFTTFSGEGLLLPERARIILDYSAEANVVMKFDPETGRIIYENLIMMPGGEDSGPVQMPDGSYHALEYQEDGKWHEVEKIFTHKYEEAPTNLVPRDSTRKDLLGRQSGGGPPNNGGNQ